MTVRTPWGKAAVAVVADGEYHDIEEVYEAIMRAVPFAVAARRQEKMTASNHRANQFLTSRDVGVDQKVSTGARRIAHETIENRVRQGTWERDGDKVRRRPK